MKTSKKYIAALAVFAAGSVFFGSLPAQAEGIELDEVKIVVRGHHGEMPPPPHHPHHEPHHHPEHFGPHGRWPHEPHHSPHFGHHRHMPPPEFRRHHEDVPPPHRPHHR